MISRQLDDLFDLQPLEIAKRLCVLEFEIFKNVQVEASVKAKLTSS